MENKIIHEKISVFICAGLCFLRIRLCQQYKAANVWRVMKSYSSRNFQNVQLPSWFTFPCKWCSVLPLCYEYDQPDIPKYTRKGLWWISEITHNGLISCEETSKTCRNKTRSYTVNTGIWAHLSGKSLDKDTYTNTVSGENSSSGVKQCISWQFKGKSICALMGDCIRTWKSHLCTIQQISEKWCAASAQILSYVHGCKKTKKYLLLVLFFCMCALFASAHVLLAAHNLSQIF